MKVYVKFLNQQLIKRERERERERGRACSGLLLKAIIELPCCSAENSLTVYPAEGQDTKKGVFWVWS